VPYWKSKEGNGLISSVMTAYLILLLHVLLLVAIGVLVLIFRGLVNYMVWIVLGGAAFSGFSIWWIYRRLKTEGQNIGEVLNSDRFKGQTVEVNLLGGLASFKVGLDSGPRLLNDGESTAVPQLEDAETIRIRELTELAKLLQGGLITRDEYEKAKHQIFRT
jgi:hypothetical protein